MLLFEYFECNAHEKPRLSIFASELLWHSSARIVAVRFGNYDLLTCVCYVTHNVHGSYRNESSSKESVIVWWYGNSELR